MALNIEAAALLH